MFKSVVSLRLKSEPSKVGTRGDRTHWESRDGMVRTPLSTVVVADPDRFYQQRIAAALQPSFRCILVGSLREAYQAILHARPDMLILELNQPDGDGLALIRHLQTTPALREILIACLTQRSTMRDKLLAFRAGADDYLVKPLSSTFYGQMLLLKRAGHMARAYALR